MLNAVKTTIAMAVITKNNLKYLTESVKYLYNIGFRIHKFTIWLYTKLERWGFNYNKRSI